jgi:sec-independent protein translocase protein TatA
VVGDILQPTHLIFVLAIALLVLGPKRLPEVGRSLGKGLRDFKEAISGEEHPRPDELGPPAAVAVPGQPEPAVQVPPQPAVQVPPQPAVQVPPQPAVQVPPQPAAPVEPQPAAEPTPAPVGYSADHEHAG